MSAQIITFPKRPLAPSGEIPRGMIGPAASPELAALERSVAAYALFAFRVRKELGGADALGREHLTRAAERYETALHLTLSG